MQILVTDLTAKLSALRNCPYFDDLSQEALNKLVQGMTLIAYKRGDPVFWQGEPCTGLHIVHHGNVKLFKLSPQGRELIVNVLQEGETFNEVPVFDGGANPVNVAALEDCTLWVIGSTTIRHIMVEHPEMCQAVIVNLSANLRRFVHKIEELSFYQVTNRLARLISQLPEEQLAGESSVRLPQDQLAARLGTVREVAARSLHELERSETIKVNRRRIYILDPLILQAWADEPDISIGS